MAQDILSGLDQVRRLELEASYAAAQAVKRRTFMIGAAIFLAAVLGASVVAGVDIGKFAANWPKFFKYIGDILPKLSLTSLGADLAEWFWGWKHWLKLLLETLLIAYLGTVLGAIGGFFLSFVAAGNLVKSKWLRFATRRFLEICRTVPEIVFALIFVVAFGLGPLPGVLAIAIHTAGALGKLYSEVVENIDMKPVDGIVSTGANFVQVVRFAVMPQVLSSYASYTLLRFEINVREAGIMGFVGAGGIGQELLEAVRKFYYSDVSAILVTIIVTVMIIDFATERLRHSMISGLEAR